MSVPSKHRYRRLMGGQLLVYGPAAGLLTYGAAMRTPWLVATAGIFGAVETVGHWVYRYRRLNARMRLQEQRLASEERAQAHRERTAIALTELRAASAFGPDGSLVVLPAHNDPAPVHLSRSRRRS